MKSDSIGKRFARETKIRDLYASRLTTLRPQEKLLKTEAGYESSLCRADMRTVDVNNVIREWEFKLSADYRALGQVLQYLALCRKERNFERDILAVIAAFKFTPELQTTVRVLNLGIELVVIPAWASSAGGVPIAKKPIVPFIPTSETNMDNS